MIVGPSRGGERVMLGKGYAEQEDGSLKVGKASMEENVDQIMAEVIKLRGCTRESTVLSGCLSNKKVRHIRVSTLGQTSASKLGTHPAKEELSNTDIKAKKTRKLTEVSLGKKVEAKEKIVLGTKGGWFDVRKEWERAVDCSVYLKQLRGRAREVKLKRYD